MLSAKQLLVDHRLATIRLNYLKTKKLTKKQFNEFNALYEQVLPSLETQINKAARQEAEALNVDFSEYFRSIQ